MAQKFLTDIEVTRGLVDSSGDLGVAGQVLSSTGSGTNWITNEANSTVVYLDEFTGDNSTVDFTISVSVTDENITQVYIDGVYQNKDTYSVSGTTLTFSTAPPLNADIEVITFSTATTSDDLAAGSVIIPVKNTHTASIAKGEPVYITGNVGSSARLEIAPADASNSAKMPAAGLLLQTLAVNVEGYVITGGYLRNITTDTIDGTSTSSNDTVYVKSGGGLTMTKPTGTNLIQNIAKVARVASGSAGSLLVSSILRTNDVPNITNDYFWLGNSSGVATPTEFTSTARGLLSVGAEGTAAGDGDLAYNNSSGVFTYTPPVLGGLSGTTDDITEGSTNLYYTDARSRSSISAGGDLSYNSTTGVMSYTTPTTIASLSNHDTDDLSEGATNLYYTDTRVGTYLTNNSYATQSYVNTQVSNLVDSAPSTLDTLNELAAALGDDANFSTTVTNSIATKLPLAGGTLTGALSGTSATFSGNVTGANLNISNWDTAYGWGDHASAGYLASSSYTASDVLTKIKTVDGSNSGLDADLLDGVQGNQFLISTTSPGTAGTNANTNISIGDNGTSYTYVQSHGSKPLNFNPVGNTVQIAGNRILTTADEGSGNGIDADTVDGQHASAFASSSHTHAASDITSGNLAAARNTANLVNVGSTSDASGIYFRSTNEIISGEGWCTAQYAYNENDGFLFLNRNSSSTAFPTFHIGGWNNAGYISGYSNADGLLTLTRSDGSKSTGSTYAGTGLSNTSYYTNIIKTTTKTVFRDAQSLHEFTGDVLMDHLNLGGATGDNGEDLKLGGIRGRFTNELIHLYNRVNIGFPNGWAGQSAPIYGLSVYGGVELATNTSYTTSGGSMRAPQFYDKDNTGYHWNPATDTSHRFTTPAGYIDIGPKNSSYCHIYTDRSNFYFNKDTLYANSTSNVILHGGNWTSYVFSGTWNASNMPGSRWGGFSVNGGEIVFQRDNPSSGKMSVMVDGSFYAGENGGFWSLWSGNNYNNKVGIYGDTNGNLQIGTSSTENVLRTNYGYVQVGPMNSSHAHIYTDRSNFYFNKQIQLLGGSLINANDIRAQEFIDLNNTGYYVNPSSSSNFSHVMIGDGNANNGAQSLALNDGELAFRDDADHFHKMWYYDGVNIATNRSHGHVRIWGENSNTIRNSSTGATTLIADFDCANDVIWLYNDTRSPIFRDSNNTNYYVDPASGTTLNGNTRITNTRFGVSTTGSFNFSTGYGFHTIENGSSNEPICMFYHQVATTSTQFYGLNVISAAAHNNTTSRFFLGQGGSTERIKIYSNGNIQNSNNSYGQLSDINLKENIVDATPKLDDINQVRVVNFNYIGDVDEETNIPNKQIGVVAQELEEIFPGMVYECGDTETPTKSVKYSVFVPMLIKAVQELTQEVQTLKDQINGIN